MEHLLARPQGLRPRRECHHNFYPFSLWKTRTQVQNPRHFITSQNFAGSHNKRARTRVDVLRISSNGNTCLLIYFHHNKTFNKQKLRNICYFLEYLLFYACCCVRVHFEFQKLSVRNEHSRSIEKRSSKISNICNLYIFSIDHTNKVNKYKNKANKIYNNFHWHRYFSI